MAPPEPSGLAPIEAKIVSAEIHQIAMVAMTPKSPPNLLRFSAFKLVLELLVRAKEEVGCVIVQGVELWGAHHFWGSRSR